MISFGTTLTLNLRSDRFNELQDGIKSGRREAKGRKGTGEGRRRENRIREAGGYNPPSPPPPSRVSAKLS